MADTIAAAEAWVRQAGAVDADELKRLDRDWRAANYLSVGQIYLMDNPLLKEPLRPEHIKPRLLGHWGTTPGLNFIYAHLNRMIRLRDLNVIYICGPGHGAPGLVANTYLEGTYSEIYPSITEDAEGIKRLFRQFSFPGGIPSDAAPEMPGSIHEGGELGYSLLHAYDAAFDNPDLVVACVIGDGEAETGPLAASWHSNKFLNPVNDGAVLPILHLNGYEIANPTILARMTDRELHSLLEGYGYAPVFVAGHDPTDMHRQMATALKSVLDDVADIQCRARQPRAGAARPAWPMIVLRSPKDRPARSKSTARRWRGCGGPIRSRFRAPRGNSNHLALLENWMRSYRPDELFDQAGRLAADLRTLAPTGRRRMGANAHANGGLLKRDLVLPDPKTYALTVEAPGQTSN